MSELHATQQDQVKPPVNSVPETPDKVLEYKYTIQGAPFRQTELTIAEDITMIKLFKDDLGGDNAKTLMETIGNLENIESLLKIILKGDHTAIRFADIKNSELEQVMTDFFLLNNSMIKKFMSLGLYFQNPTMTAETKTKEK